MAPPRHRRTGQSRRAQYGRFFGYVAAVVGVIISLLLLLLAVLDPRGFSAVKSTALDATTPISSAGRAVLRGITDFGQSIGDYFEAGRQNGELRDQLHAAEAKLTQAQAASLENQRLRQLLQLRDATADEVATGRIVSSSWDSARRYAILSVGSSEGVAYNMPVRAPEGLIGRVVEVGNWGARVLLIVDGASTVPVRSVRDGTPALAVGTGEGELRLQTIEVGVSPFKPGDMLVTSGVGGIYPPDIPVAQVVRIESEVAYARPLASPARIDYAIVQPLFQPAALPQSQGGTAPPAGAGPPR
jgi:rod shape-determining protein MreC